MDKIEKNQPDPLNTLNNFQKKVKKYSRLYNSIGQLNKIREDLEDDLEDDEYQEVCDSVATITTYIQVSIKRANIKLNSK